MKYEPRPYLYISYVCVLMGLQLIGEPYQWAAEAVN
jgi:hypothetical protein